MEEHMTRRSRWRRGRDERGATFVLTAICLTLLLWGGAMGVDIGFTVTSSRQAQAMADTAALDMARYINLADSQRIANYSSYINGKLANVQTDNNAGNVTFTATGEYWSHHRTGRVDDPRDRVLQTVPATCYPVYCSPGHGDAERAPDLRQREQYRDQIGPGCRHPGGRLLGRLLPGFVQLTAVGRSQYDPEHARDATSTISAVNYAGLANSYVTVQQLMTASAGALTPSNILTVSLPASSWLSFLTTAIGTQQSALNCAATPEPSACVAYPVLEALSFGGSSVTLCQLVTINGPNCGGTDIPEAALSASLNVLQTLTTEAELANGTNAIDIQSALGITGVGDATLTLQVVSPPQLAYGPAGTTATSAQVNGDLKLSGGLLGGTLDIPVTGAQGTATLSSVSCSQSDNSFTSAAIHRKRYYRERCSDFGRRFGRHLDHQRCLEHRNCVSLEFRPANRLDPAGQHESDLLCDNIADL